MKRISLKLLVLIPLLVSVPWVANAYTVVINGQSFQTKYEPNIDINYMSDGVEITINEVNISGGTAYTSTPDTSNSSTPDTSNSSTPDTSNSSTPDTSNSSTPDTTTTSSQGCDNTSRVTCHDDDWGPAGLANFWSTSHAVPGGRVLAVPFTVKQLEGTNYGFITTSRQVGQDPDGYSIRMWFSEEPGGKRVAANAFCGRETSATGGVRWSQAADRSGYCTLPSKVKKTFYYNVALCNAADPSDVECLGKAEFNPRDFYIRFSASSY